MCSLCQHRPGAPGPGAPEGLFWLTARLRHRSRSLRLESLKDESDPGLDAVLEASREVNEAAAQMRAVESPCPRAHDAFRLNLAPWELRQMLDAHDLSPDQEAEVVRILLEDEPSTGDADAA